MSSVRVSHLRPGIDLVVAAVRMLRQEYHSHLTALRQAGQYS